MKQIEQVTESQMTMALQLAVLFLALVFTTGCAAMASFPSASSKQKAPSEAEKRDQSRIMVASGNAALIAGDDRKALMDYVAALQLNPEDVEVRIKVGQLHERRGDSQAALKAYNDVLRMQPTHPVALEGAGLALIRNQQANQAKTLLEQAIAQDSHRWRAYNGLGVIADLNRDPGNASVYYRKALALQPQMSMLHNNLGYSRYLAGDYTMAVVHFERALKANPDNKTAWANLGLVKVRMGNVHAGMGAFVEIMEPYRAHNNVGYLSYMSGDYDTARTHLKEAIAQSPSYYALAEQNLARVETNAGE